MVEPTGRQHNSASRVDPHLTSVVGDDGPGDPAPFGDQPHQCGLRPHADAGAQHTGEQAGGQSLPACGVAPAEHQSTDTLGESFDDER